MTRANLIIKRAHKRTIELHWGSDAYPEEVKPFLYALIHEGFLCPASWSPSRTGHQAWRGRTHTGAHNREPPGERPV